MCGIVGYVGQKQAAPLLLDGLTKLEYRGYDSAGVAVYDGSAINVVKAEGRLVNLRKLTNDGKNVKGVMGIGHTRWATHGAPSDVNAHPHISNSGKFAVVHNGIIENYLELKQKLIKKGCEFHTETDTEVIAQLIDAIYKGDLLSAVVELVRKIKGSYALGIICADNPDCFVAVKKDSPLIVGLGKDENFIASDIPAILPYTRKVYNINDNEIVMLTKDSVTVYNSDMEVIDKEVFEVNWDVHAAEKGGYEHFMFKEIMEQPKAIRNTVSPRIKDGKVVLDNISLTECELRKLKRIYILACGSAYHVGVVGKYFIEKMTHIPVEVDVASEFRYRDPCIDENCLAIIISQSGETADTLAALREAKRKGARVLSIVNVVGSSITKESDDVMYTWAGPEIAVATTKAYSTQLTLIYLFGIYAASLLGTASDEHIENLIADIEKLPDIISALLEKKEKIQYLASRHYNSKEVFFLGRNMDYAVGLEGSLKLKEISYIHSEAYAAGEIKHGTISLIEDGSLVIALVTQKELSEKMISNIKEVKARGAVVIAVTTDDNTLAEQVADSVIKINTIDSLLMPSLTIIPLQLFAYYVSSMKGCDIDKPRNLAKSVTVE
ncbi:MAG: glutamine--fructose-6-phosphate transaminase (isomerizing) [Clostridia bacterium]|nr:glutamine--fructose-6-phosphate transaminase (isomerizing) [Clostridia bacterium]